MKRMNPLKDSGSGSAKFAKRETPLPTQKKKEGKVLTYKEIYRTLVIEHRLVTSGYFLNDLDWLELDLLLSNLHYSYKNEWEQTRLLSYITAQVQSTKNLQLTDILQFPWEQEGTFKGNTEGFDEKTIKDTARETNRLLQLINRGIIDFENE